MSPDPSKGHVTGVGHCACSLKMKIIKGNREQGTGNREKGKGKRKNTKS